MKGFTREPMMREQMMVEDSANLDSTSAIGVMPFHGFGGYRGYDKTPHMLGSITWLLFIALLVALIRLVWRKGDEK